MTPTPLHTFLHDYAAAVLAADLPRFMDLYADDTQVFDSWDCWSYDGAAPWRDMIQAWFSGISDVRVRVTAEDQRAWTDGQLAGGSATLEFAALDASGQATRATKNRLTVILQQQDGRWRVVHQHTSVPVDFHSKQVIGA